MPDRSRARRAPIAGAFLLLIVAAAVGFAIAFQETTAATTATGVSRPGTQLRGFHYTAWFDDDNSTIERRLDDVRAAGGNIIRVPFAWPVYEPRPRQIDNRALDHFEFLSTLLASAGSA